MKKAFLLICVVFQFLSCSRKIEETPKAFDVYMSAVNAKYGTGDYIRAIEMINKGIEIFPDRAADWIEWRAFCKEYLKDYDGAINDFNKCIEIDPLKAENYYNRGRIKALMKKYPDAILDFTKSIEIDSSDHVAYFGRGNAKFEMQEYQEAIYDYNLAIGNYEHWLDANFNRGMAELKLGQMESACKDFQIAKKQAIIARESGNKWLSEKYFKNYCN